MESVKRKRTAYDASFKLKVVLFAEEENNSAASRHFGVNEKQVREWRKNKTSLNAMPKTKKALRTGVESYPGLEKDLNEWVLECRSNGCIITRTAIRLKALKMCKDEKFRDLIPATFKASAGWCTRFMNRFGLCLRQRTKIGQKLPKQLEEKIESFQKFVIKLRKQKDFDLSQIGNMDETPVTFDLPSNKTVDKIGEKTVFIKTTNHEKTHFTVVLSCLADGTKLPPVIIFKRKTIPSKIKFPTGIIVKAHKAGWMDENGTLDWLQNVWNKRPGAVFKKPALLVWDMFNAHRTDQVKRKAENLKTSLAVIPGGLTSVLQPFDVCLNKPFKDALRKLWNEWMCSPDVEKTKGGNLKKADIGVIASWVKSAWMTISPEMIKKSFKKCCISNAMDGTEDDIIYESESDEGNLCDSESSDDNDCYNDAATEAEFRELFGDSENDSEFDGFC